MLATVLALCAASAAGQERLLPSLDYAGKTPAEWMQAFEQDPAHDPGPLWCLYWSDARTREVIEFLSRWRAKLPDYRVVGRSVRRERNVAREIEAILTQWNTPHEAMQPQWDERRDGVVMDELPRDIEWLHADHPKPPPPNTRWYRVPSGLFPRPTATLEKADPELVALLESRDLVERAEAAVTLISRRREVPAAVRSLTLHVAADRARGLRGRAPGAMQVIAGDFVGEIATSHVREPSTVQVFELDRLSAYTLDWATGVLGTSAARVLAEMIGSSEAEAEAVERVCSDSFGSPAARFDAESRFLLDVAWAKRRGEPVPARRIRPPPSTSIVPPNPPPGSAARIVDCNESGSLDEAAAKGSSRIDRVRALAFALCMRVSASLPIDDALRALLAELHVPYRADGAISGEDWYLVGLTTFAKLRITTPDVADWCLEILIDEEHFPGHVSRALEILEHCDLNLRQRALAAQMSEMWISTQEIRPTLYTQLGAVAIERAARLRTHAQAWTDMNVLRDLLKISRPSSQDLEMIVAALERGFAADRAIALAILDEQASIATPDVHAAVLAACDDCDDTVRDAARALKAKRRW